MIVPVERVWQLPGVPVIDVADIDALVRIADQYERSILHETSGAGAAFWVTDESGQFRYAPGTSAAASNGASATDRRPGAGAGDREPSRVPGPAAGISPYGTRPVTAVYAVPAEPLAAPAIADAGEPGGADWRAACEDAGVVLEAPGFP